MGLNDTPSGERIHIGFFGRRNAGKSSLVNAVTGQELSVVSDVKGTTTDPVYKAMELLPLGPVEIIDTPGFDDTGTLGELRVRKTRQILAKTDIAVLVIDASENICQCDRELINLFEEKNIPYIKVFNKSDTAKIVCKDNEIAVSSLNGTNIYELKEKIASMAKNNTAEKHLVADLIEKGDLIVLVMPIDSAAPKGRIILPQQQAIRDILDTGAVAVAVRETELEETLFKINRPQMVITDSQAFAYVSKIVPDDIPLTSFSILMARYKGFLETAVKGSAKIKNLKDGDTVLISEGCTHHRQCGDIGSVKLPALLKKYTGKNLVTELSSGRDFPENPEKYALVIHCGGCMLNEREMQSRQNSAVSHNVPFTNYGTAIAMMNGILERSLEIFPDILRELQ